MGEYAMHGSDEVKIGTMEEMYYLRADQRHRVRPLRGNVDPARQAEALRFRFPFPDEDGIPPGGFLDAFRGVGLYGVEHLLADVEHTRAQFTAAGYLVSLPCPESKEGAALRFARNGNPGPVQIVQQRLVAGLWVVICQCTGCGAKFRLPTLAEAEPLIAACRAEADRYTRPPGEDGPRALWWHRMADRIAAGYQPAEAIEGAALRVIGGES